MEKHSAPSLSRGITILRMLENSERLSLHEMSSKAGLPKSSLLRMLGVLLDMHLVARDEKSNCYYALSRLVPLNNAEEDFSQKLTRALETIVSETGNTAEWYVPDRAGMILVQRAEPKTGEIRIRAGIGFVRKWEGELDAVATLGHAWYSRRPREITPFWIYIAGGKRRDLSREKASRRIGQGKRNGFAVDHIFNSNGVRRMAAVVMEKDRMSGTLVIAEFMKPAQQKKSENVNVLLEQAAVLSRKTEFPKGGQHENTIH